jgi:hypothetical protein
VGTLEKLAGKASISNHIVIIIASFCRSRDRHGRAIPPPHNQKVGFRHPVWDLTQAMDGVCS